MPFAAPALQNESTTAEVVVRLALTRLSAAAV
jgi:hypothetical protein